MDRIQALSQQLQATRKEEKAPEDYPKKGDLKKFKNVFSSSKVLSAKDGAKEIVDISIDDEDTKIAVLGGAQDFSVIGLYDRTEKST